MSLEIIWFIVIYGIAVKTYSYISFLAILQKMWWLV